MFEAAGSIAWLHDEAEEAADAADEAGFVDSRRLLQMAAWHCGRNVAGRGEWPAVSQEVARHLPAAAQEALGTCAEARAAEAAAAPGATAGAEQGGGREATRRPP
eukprot:5349484-Alexandrium_andersonii.AAC.1